MAVIVTGAAGYLGEGIVAALGDAGRRIVAVDRDSGALDRLAARHPSVASTAVADVTDPAANRDIADRVAEEFGVVEAAVAAAGVEGPYAPIEDMAASAIEEVFRINALAVYWLAAAVVPHFKRAGGGRFVPIASGSGRSGSAFTSPYNGSKHAVVGLTRALAKELGPHGIAVNAVCPGFVASPMADRVIDEEERLTGTRPDYVAAIPVGRMGERAEVASLVAYLVCHAPLYLNGACLDIDGGMRA